MKLKQLVFNTLQRPKSKHKKEKEQNIKQPVTSAIRRPPHPPLIPRGRECMQPPTPRACGPLAEEQESRASPQEPNTNSARGCVASDRPNITLKSTQHSGHVTPTRAENAVIQPSDNVGSKPKPKVHIPAVPPDSLNFNVDTKDFKCACYKHMSPLDSSPEDAVKSAYRDTGGYSSVSSAEDSGFISLPKIRTRIKTNPWLPSPRSSPLTTPEISPTSSFTPSPVCAEQSPFTGKPVINASIATKSEGTTSGKVRRKRRERMASDITDTLTTPLNIPLSMNINCKLNTTYPVTLLGDSDSALHDTFNSDSDNVCTRSNSALPTSPDSNTSHSLLFSNKADQHGIDAGSVTTSCSGLDGSLLHEQLLKHEVIPDTAASFDYEEAFEQQLEVKSVAQYVGSRDDLSDTLRERIIQDPLGSRAHDFDSEYCPSVYDSSPDYTDGTDDTVCDDYYTDSGFRTHGRPATFNDLFREFYCGSDGADSEVSDTSDDADITQGQKGRISQRGAIKNRRKYRKAVASDCCQGKVVQQHHTEIENRVRQIQYETVIVNEKVCETREANAHQQQELKRHKKEVNVFRKRLLLRTLQELRSKLEDQSRRLQQTYTTVLSMQFAVICDRKDNAQAKRNAVPADIREAPF